MQWKKSLALAAVATWMLSACSHAPNASTPSKEGVQQQQWAKTWSQPLAQAGDWAHYTLPSKTATQYRFVQDAALNKPVLWAKASASASGWRRPVHVSAQSVGQVHFSWKVAQAVAQGNVSQRALDDTPARVMMMFKGDRSKFSLKNKSLSELAELMTGEPLPYATLMYVWDAQLPVGTVVTNPRTDRIRKIVVESGVTHLGQWRHYTRDVAADFASAFGEPVGDMEMMAVMTDTDNTGEIAQAWYGAIELSAAVPGTQISSVTARPVAPSFQP